MLSKLEKYLFYLLLFFIPFQARKILYFSGWKFNEWQSISLYATDILLLILFIFWAANKFSVFPFSKLRILNLLKGNFQFSIFKNPNFYLLLFLVISAFSIKNSGDYIISTYQWIKLLEFTFFYLYLSSYALNKFGLFNSLLAIILGGLFQAILAIGQFLKQSSLGFKYLGESLVNTDFIGVASFYLPTGEKIIRAYGTTPHPNVLAGFLLLSLFAFYFVYLYFRLHSEHRPFADSWDRFFIISYGVMLFGFFITFSRTIIFIWFISFCVRAIIIRARRHYRLIFGSKDGRRRIRTILLVSFFIIVLFGSIYFNETVSRLTIGGDDQAIQLRSFYTQEALSIYPNLLGVGVGNFISWLIDKNPLLPDYAYQPVHNIYLLIYSETGIFGISVFILFLFFLVKDFILKTRLQKSYHLSLLVFFCSLFFIGLFDHFFWTLQQGRFIFWSGLGLLTYLSKNDRI